MTKDHRAMLTHHLRDCYWVWDNWPSIGVQISPEMEFPPQSLSDRIDLLEELLLKPLIDSIQVGADNE